MCDPKGPFITQDTHIYRMLEVNVKKVQTPIDMAGEAVRVIGRAEISQVCDTPQTGAYSVP